MRYKILTVDDSKTVRIIVRKAFRGFDCEILEASNGAEGLAVAKQEKPHLILLDVTMPVMDGVEMLSKLKADPAIKSIPVIMLTAEGGRDNVLKIARIGVRDYLVKPFKEEVLVEQAGRVIDLKPLAEAPAKAKTIFDPAEILLVEDQPAVAQQIQDGLKHTPWKIHRAGTQAEAVEFCKQTQPDLIFISLSLADESAFRLFRLMRSGLKTKATPIFALVTRADVQQQQQAQTVGFSAIITTPPDLGDLETKMAKAMSLDLAQRYYAHEGDITIMRLPQHHTLTALTEAGGYLKPKLSEAVDAGRHKLVIDLRSVETLPAGAGKVLLQAMKISRDLGMQVVLVGNAQLVTEGKGLDEARSWTFVDTLEAAKASLEKMPALSAAV